MQMATSKEYLEYVKEQLSEIEGIAFRPMMGEYVIYYRDKVVGGIYDNRVLIKPVKAAKELPGAVYEIPYSGAKEMILLDIEREKENLFGLLEQIYSQLPVSKRKSRQK